MKAVIFGVASYVVLFVLLTVSWLVQYDATAYEVDVAKEWIYRARATNDLVDMSIYLNKSLEQLEPFNGNPKWIFKKPDTDFNLIKSNIRECIVNCANYSQLENEMAYQQAVHNLQETELEIAEHLDLASWWTMYSAGFFFLWAFMFSAIFWLWIPLWLFVDAMMWD